MKVTFDKISHGLMIFLWKCDKRIAVLFQEAP